MKVVSILLIFSLLAATQRLNAQTNWFPSSGNVGIGTTSPGEELTVNGTGSVGTEIVTDGTATSRPVLGFFRGSGFWHVGINIDREDSDDLHFRYNGTSYPFAIRASTGNVGIGTVNPTSKLHVYSASLVDRISIQSSLTNSNVGFMIMNQDGSERWSMASVYDRDYFQFYRAGFGNVMVLRDNGNVGIGTTSPNEKLTVNGTIYGKEVKVDLSVPGPDYVFNADYSLPTLDELRAYIKSNKHLPEVPSAAEMEKDGINVGEMNMILLKKVEEMTLYILQQNEQLERQQEEIELLKERIK